MDNIAYQYQCPLMSSSDPHMLEICMSKEIDCGLSRTHTADDVGKNTHMHEGRIHGPSSAFEQPKLDDPQFTAHSGIMISLIQEHRRQGKVTGLHFTAVRHPHLRQDRMCQVGYVMALSQAHEETRHCPCMRMYASCDYAM
jgi:hypothetical protein